MTFETMPENKRRAICKAIWARGESAADFAWSRRAEAVSDKKQKTAKFWMSFYVWVSSL